MSWISSSVCVSEWNRIVHESSSWSNCCIPVNVYLIRIPTYRQIANQGRSRTLHVDHVHLSVWVTYRQYCNAHQSYVLPNQSSRLCNVNDTKWKELSSVLENRSRIMIVPVQDILDRLWFLNKSLPNIICIPYCWHSPKASDLNMMNW